MYRHRVGLEGIVRPGHGDTTLLNHLDLLGPRIDERDVVACAGEEGAEVAADRACTDEKDPRHRYPPPDPLKIEKSTAFSVMNSSNAGVPSRVLAMARLMAGTIAPGSVTRSPQPPSARANSA